MSRAFEYLLKAENYALAAKLAEGRKRMALLGAAAYWRNRAFDVRTGRSQHLRESPHSETSGQAAAD